MRRTNFKTVLPCLLRKAIETGGGSDELPGSSLELVTHTSALTLEWILSRSRLCLSFLCPPFGDAVSSLVLVGFDPGRPATSSTHQPQSPSSPAFSSVSATSPGGGTTEGSMTKLSLIVPFLRRMWTKFDLRRFGIGGDDGGDVGTLGPCALFSATGKPPGKRSGAADV